MAFFQQLTKTIPSRSPQPSPKQREPPGLGLFQDLSNLYPAVNTNPSTNPHAVQTSNAPGTSNEQLAVSPVSHASSAHVDWPHQPEVTQADTDQLAAADAVEAAEKGDATASELTQAAPANEDPSSEDIWEILLRQAQGSADPQPSNSDPPPATGSSEFSSAPTPSALDAPVIPAAAPASGSGTLQQARRKSSLSVFATVEQLTPTPAEQSRSTPAPQSNDLPAHIAAAYSMPPIQPAQMQRTHTSTQPAGAISSPQVALPVQCPARLQDTNGPRQPSDMSTSAQVGLPLPYGKPISQNDLNKLLDPGCWMYNEELCMSWRVLTKEVRVVVTL